MAERRVTLDMGNVGPRQRVNHAHITEEAVVLHWHEGEEPDRPDGIVVPRAAWTRIMDAAYWKREEVLEAEEGEDAPGVETHVGYVDFTFKKGKKKAQEEVSVPSLQQVDARMRRRHR